MRRYIGRDLILLKIGHVGHEKRENMGTRRNFSRGGGAKITDIQVSPGCVYRSIRKMCKKLVGPEGAKRQLIE